MMSVAGFLMARTALLFSVGLMVQGTGPTVGDTIWLTRTVRVASGYTVRAADWEPSEPVQLLARARVLVTGDSAEIAYPVVLWQPGRHLVELPGPLLLGPGGTVDSLGPETVRLEIESVLPRVPADSALPPQPRAALVQRRSVSIAPLALLWVASLLVLLPVHLWWRRRGKPTRGAPMLIPSEALQPPVARWADAGEHRAVAHLVTAQLRADLANQVPAAHSGLDTERVLAELAAARPGWPLEELGTLLRSLDDARFGTVTSADALRLSRSSLALRDRLLHNAA